MKLAIELKGNAYAAVVNRICKLRGQRFTPMVVLTEQEVADFFHNLLKDEMKRMGDEYYTGVSRGDFPPYPELPELS